MVTIPKEEMEKQGLQEGAMMWVEVRKVEVTMRPRLSPGLATPICAIWPIASGS